MRPKLILFLGVQLSGKTTLAEAVARRENIVFVNLDEVRKKLFGPVLSGPKDWVNEEAKKTENQKVQFAYDCLFVIFEKILASGASVVAEMPWLGKREEQLEQIIKSTHANLKIIWCRIDNDSDEEIRKRAQKRLADPGLAPVNAENYRMFKDRVKEPKLEHLVVNTSEPIRACLEQITEYL